MTKAGSVFRLSIKCINKYVCLFCAGGRGKGASVRGAYVHSPDLRGPTSKEGDIGREGRGREGREGGE